MQFNEAANHFISKDFTRLFHDKIEDSSNVLKYVICNSLYNNLKRLQLDDNGT